MSLTGNNGLLAAAGANQPAYSIDESLRITEAGGLRRMQTGGNLRKFTFSTWVKLGDIEQDSAYEKCLYTAGNLSDGSGYTDFIYFAPFASGGRPIRMVVSASGALAGSIITTPFYNDPASWYHVVAVWDSANATGADRMIIYVNGTRQDIGTITTPAQNTDSLYFNANTKQSVIGNYAYYWNPANPTHAQHATDGYMAETYFIDGSVVAPSVFAEADEDTNLWKPKNNSDVKSAVTFGTNGFYLNYSDSSSLGTDSSGKGNNFTPGNLVATDQVLDSPSNNFATLNPLYNWSTSTDADRVYAEGNLKGSSSATGWKTVSSSQAIESGKWYWETTCFGSYNWQLGLARTDLSTTSNIGLELTGSYCVYCSGAGTGGTFVNSTNTGNNSYIWAANDIIMCAYDDATGKFWLGKNGTWFTSGNPATGANADFTVITADLGDMVPAFSYYASTDGMRFNFGADSSFAGQKTAQGNGGVGEDFYYTPPTGYKALNTNNLDDPSIVLPTEYFNTNLWTGTGGTRSLTGVGFQPVFTWIKSRSDGLQHMLFDSVRGATKYLVSDAGDAGATDATQLTAFDSDGFSLGSGTVVNGTSKTFVGWNWKGSDTPTKTFVVTVTNPGSGNRYTLDGKVSGTNAMPITIEEGGTYTFDQSDNSNSGHPLRFSTTANGTHGGGSEYTTGVTVSGTPGSAGAKTVITVAASAATLYFYCTAHSGMGAQASTPGSGGGVSNLSGTIASVVNATTTAGFSIATYTGNGTSPSTIGHGLSVAPEMVMVKNRTTAAENWVVSIGNITGTNGDFIILNQDAALQAGTSQFPSQPGSSTFAVTDAANVNTNTSNYIAYCFHSVDGYSKVGKYTGNGATNGPFIYTGFRPAFIMVKLATAASGQWAMFDNKRDPDNPTDRVIYANLTNADTDVSSYYPYNLLSNGFKSRIPAGNGNEANYNTSSQTYLYLAFAESPFKYATAR